MTARLVIGPLVVAGVVDDKLCSVTDGDVITRRRTCLVASFDCLAGAMTIDLTAPSIPVTYRRSSAFVHLYVDTALQTCILNQKEITS